MATRKDFLRSLKYDKKFREKYSKENTIEADTKTMWWEENKREVFLTYYTSSGKLEPGQFPDGMGFTKAEALEDIKKTIQMKKIDPESGIIKGQTKLMSDLFIKWTRADIDNRRDGLGELSPEEGKLIFDQERYDNE